MLKRKPRFGFLCAYVFLVLATTIFDRTQFTTSGHDFIPLHFFGNSEKRLQFLSNVVLFVPIGFLLAGYSKHKRIILAGFILSVCIESTQLIMRIGFCELDDVIANTLGTIIGFCIGTIVDKYRLFRNTSM